MRFVCVFFRTYFNKRNFLRKNHMTDIIVVGPEHHNTLSMLRSFGEEGRMVKLYIYGTYNSYIASSIYIKDILYFSTALDAINTIASFESNVSIKPLVIACSDEVASLMDERYDELITKCIFFNAGTSGRLTSFMDKQKQLELAKDCGFCVPSSIDSLPYDINIENVNFPCLIKPKESIHGGKKVSICYDTDDLKKVLITYNPKFSVLVQDYIHKDYEIVILGMSYGGKVFIPGFVHKHREEKGGTTFSTVKPITKLDPHIVEACYNLVIKINYNGLWGIECIKQGDKYFFLELNMRNDATTYAMKVAGVNLPFYFLQSIEQTDMQYKIKDFHEINSMVEFSDFNFVLKGKVNVVKWLKDYRSSDCKYFYSKLDPKPYKQKRKEYIKFLIKRILKL